ncbi:DUF411 domain-containing protein [Nostoc sp. FACHB-110]|uniref:DUF411 domain-containing protein n=1 Tax=Nostoc sp. FACHB-110 TaxID=2692834 RepID=UPI001686A8F4|nr:DUF411 domain-containing protein [Nostoc sp. FACHB-110]MBD2436494.1 DUF411 domain-containing protein [Nostoc sp. FACHB-110]
MSQLKLMPRWQELLQFNLVRIAVKVLIIVGLTVGVLGILGSKAPVSSAQSLPIEVAVNTSLPKATVYRSPECSCCHGWIDHLKSQGFQVTDVSTNDIEAIKQNYHVPDNLASCHTAVVNGYVVEGHVPAQDIKRLLQEQPNVAGLSVPQMPVGTPGMEMGNQKDPFNVVSFDSQGTAKIFNQYPAS